MPVRQPTRLGPHLLDTAAERGTPVPRGRQWTAIRADLEIGAPFSRLVGEGGVKMRPSAGAFRASRPVRSYHSFFPVRCFDDLPVATRGPFGLPIRRGFARRGHVPEQVRTAAARSHEVGGISAVPLFDACL